MDYIINGVAAAVEWCGIDSEFVAALPTAIMKPLSGSGARGLMVDAMTTYGADSFVGRMACIFQGSTDTTFYILAVYFGSVGITYLSVIFSSDSIKILSSLVFKLVDA